MGHNLNDPMEPWGAPTTVASVLDHRALGYTYDTELTVMVPVKKAIDDPPIHVKKVVDDPVVPKKIRDGEVIKKIGDEIVIHPGDPIEQLQTQVQMPFALATPHHSAAWAGGGQQATTGAVTVETLAGQLAQRTAELEAVTAQHRALLAATQGTPQAGG
jgi:hypothetical protein